MASLADTGSYLDQLYREKFNREPDEAGKAYWQAEIDSGKTSPERVAELFDASDEAKEIKQEKEADNRNFIESTYELELDRDADEDGADYWTEQLNSGTQTRQEVVDNIRSSDEYTENARDYLEGLYDEILERDPDEEGMQYWIEDLQGGQTREQVRENFENSDESWLGDVYKDELGRNLGDTGRNYWLDDLKGKNEGQDGRKATREEVLDNIRRSDEYACAQSGGIWDGSTCNTSNPEDTDPEDTDPVDTDPVDTDPVDTDPLEEPGETFDPGHREPDEKSKEEDDGGTRRLYDDRYQKLKSDYDDLKRSYDTEFGTRRDEETSRLRSGFTVGGFPGSRRTNLSSGSTATSDRSRKRSQITAGPKVKDDRPYARQGMRSGSDTGSTFFDPSSSFR